MKIFVSIILGMLIVAAPVLSWLLFHVLDPMYPTDKGEPALGFILMFSCLIFMIGGIIGIAAINGGFKDEC